ncbi:MAG: FKBP-type peptidyl-prolyl cis-trans isomerase [Bacteroidota bacterium]
MKSKYIFFLVIAAVGFQCDGQNKSGSTTGGAVSGIALNNKADSIGYSLGYNLGEFLKAQGVKDFAADVNEEMVIKAMKLSIAGQKSPMTREQCALAVNGFIEWKRKEVVVKNEQEGAKFMEENKSKPGVITTPSGLQYQVIKMGTGPKPMPTDQVQVHYHGTLLNGTVVDSSVDRNQPIVHPANGFIPGWNEAISMMPTGSKWKLWVPAKIGYGDQGAGQSIPPGATLVFEVELLKINP